MGLCRVAGMGLIVALAATVSSAGETALRPQLSDAAGHTLIQLGAERSEAEAAASWVRIAHGTNGILDGLVPRITPVVMPGRRRLYRLRAGPLDDASAASVCAALRARQIDCIVVR